MSGEVDKTLLAFLNGLSRRQYFGEDQFSDQFLREEILGNIDVESEKLGKLWLNYPIAFINKHMTVLLSLIYNWLQLNLLIDYMGMLKRFQTIITTMASGDMDYAQLDAFLTSQMKKRQVKY